MKTADLASALDKALSSLQLLEHPWYVRWTNGELSVDELRDYAEQYRHFEVVLPQVLQAVSDKLPAGSAKDLVLENLFDELGNGGPSHIELFDRYIDVLDGSHVAPASPAMQRLVAAYRELAESDPIEGLSGIMAYEIQAAGIAASKGGGLKEKYGMSSAQTEFWDLHATLDVDHGEWSMESMAALVDSPEPIIGSLTRTARAWWEFLDEREALRAA